MAIRIGQVPSTSCIIIIALLPSCEKAWLGWRWIDEMVNELNMLRKPLYLKTAYNEPSFSNE